MSLTLDPSLLFNAASGALLIALGLAVARLRPRTRATVALAVFSAAFGLAWFVNYGSALVLGDATPFPGWASAIFFTSLLIAAAALVVVARNAPHPLALAERRLQVLPALVAVAYAGGMTLFTAMEPGGLDSGIVVRAWAFAGFYFAILLAALRFGALRGGERGRERHQLFLLGAALMIYPATVTGIFLRASMPTQAGGFLGLMVLTLLSLLWLRNVRRVEGLDRRRARNLALLCFAIPLAALIVTDLQGGYDVAGGSIPPGAARTFSVLVLAYAILRHQLLGLDVRVRWTIKQSTLGAIFIAVFFVTSELAQTVFSERVGPLIGIVAAGALVFVLAPLQHLAERVAERAVPLPGPTRQPPSARKADVYRAMVRRLSADGVLSRDDERVLAHLAQELDIGAGDALDLRHEVERETERGGGAR